MAIIARVALGLLEADDVAAEEPESDSGEDAELVGLGELLGVIELDCDDADEGVLVAVLLADKDWLSVALEDGDVVLLAVPLADCV